MAARVFSRATTSGARGAERPGRGGRIGATPRARRPRCARRWASQQSDPGPQEETPEEAGQNEAPFYESVGGEDLPLLRRDRDGRVADYIGGSAWEKYRERDPRVFSNPSELKQAVFPESFYGTRLQRQIFPEDVGERAYVEYDTLPPYKGDVTQRAEDAEQIMNSGRMDEREIDFWFRNDDMPDTGFPLKIECDVLKDYEAHEVDREESMNDHFTPMCPSLRGNPEPESVLSVGQEITCKVIGAHVQHGVFVDLGESSLSLSLSTHFFRVRRNKMSRIALSVVFAADVKPPLTPFQKKTGASVAGLIPMYHHQGSRGLESACFEHLGVEGFDEVFGEDKEVTVRVASLRLQRYKGGASARVFRFPVECELVTPSLPESVLRKPAADDDTLAPVVIRDPRDAESWRLVAEATGRSAVKEGFLRDLEAIVDEFEMSRKEQEDNIGDMEIFDPNNDDYSKRRGSPDPLWGIKDLLDDGEP